jgi:hypothetical protein
MRFWFRLVYLFWLWLLCQRLLGYNTTLRTRVIDYLLRCLTPTALTSGGGSGVAGSITVKLHTGDPGAAGTLNEVTGGSYAPQSATFNAGSSGTSALGSDVPFGGMPVCTVSHLSAWDKAGTPLFIGAFALTASQSIGTAGATFTLQASGTSGTVT